MEALFPFGFPPRTAGYLALYVAALALHVLFMSYALAGAGYLAWAAVRRPQREPLARARPAARLLRDWLPFALGAAITTGVAPLLFVQVLYQRAFYTANLLLLHRWMAIVPALVAGFYLLYLLKSRALERQSAAAQAAIGIAAWGCLAFTGFSWAENHLLSLHAELWPAFFGTRALFYRDWELVPRVALWFAGAVPTMAVLLGWQLWLAQGRWLPEAAQECRHLSRLARGGLAVASASGAGYAWVVGGNVARTLAGALAGPYLGLAVAGLALQGIAWTVQAGRDRFEARWLAVASLGALLSVAGTAVVREARRLAALGEPPLPAAAGGLGAFAFFALLNALAIACCIFLVLRSGRSRAGGRGAKIPESMR